MSALPAILALALAAPPIGSIATNRRFDALPKHATQRERLAAAAKELGDWTLILDDVPVNGALLAKIAETPAGEPLVRAAREALHRPVDLGDLLYFLDDVLALGRTGARGQPVVLTADRARSSGVFLHPDDVFGHRPHRYGAPSEELSIEPPSKPAAFEPATDGAVLGPRWTARYPNPADEAARLAALQAARPESDFAKRIRTLIDQLRAQGAEVSLDSTVRAHERGYLMWGASWLSRAASESQVAARVKALEKANASWGLHVPIRWDAPDGWQKTVASAREMAEAYQVVYATRKGARSSNHYDGLAVDLSAVNLPRRLTLTAPDGAKRTFDLSGAEQSRDLSLTPPLIRWVERHFGLKKLKSDYPHWDDARAAVAE